MDKRGNQKEVEVMETLTKEDYKVLSKLKRYPQKALMKTVNFYRDKYCLGLLHTARLLKGFLTLCKDCQNMVAQRPKMPIEDYCVACQNTQTYNIKKIHQAMQK